MQIDRLQPMNSGMGKLRASKGDDLPAQFQEYLGQALAEVNHTQLRADQLAQDFAQGKDLNTHDVILAAEKADLALQTTARIRDKAVDAYQEIMRMQI